MNESWRLLLRDGSLQYVEGVTHELCVTLVQLSEHPSDVVVALWRGGVGGDDDQLSACGGGVAENAVVLRGVEEVVEELGRLRGSGGVGGELARAHLLLNEVQRLVRQVV